jgi:hypothetical protein
MKPLKSCGFTIVQPIGNELAANGLKKYVNFYTISSGNDLEPGKVIVSTGMMKKPGFRSGTIYFFVPGYT